MFVCQDVSGRRRGKDSTARRHYAARNRRNFREPNSGVAETCNNCTFRYVAPLGTLNVEREGYIGFVIDFRDGKASEWRIMTGYPSYAPPKMPREFKSWLWFWGIIIGLGIVSRFIIRRTPVAAVVSD